MMILRTGSRPVGRPAGRTGRPADRQTKQGFTLVEIMVSMAILSIGLVLILQGFAQSLNILRIAEDNLKATLLAENKMAEAGMSAKEEWDVFEEGLKEKFKFENMKCEWKIQVSPVEWEMEETPEAYEDLNEIKASLSWKEGKRKGKVPLMTYMRKPVETE
ncbi:MAG: type II secretion system protein [Candidatus Omnitrophota bacterium]|nr:type II secretion system protein [Candidatus Omnitrophota bacterium]